MNRKKTPLPKDKKTGRGRPKLPDGTVQTRVSLPPNTLPWFEEGAHQAGMTVPQFIGLSARHGYQAALRAALGCTEKEAA